MLEIIVLFVLTRRVGEKAIRKGLAPGTWKLYTVLAWFGFEIGGALLGMVISGNVVLAILLAYVCAAGGYLLIKYNLDKYPDRTEMDDWINHIGEGN